MVKFWTDSRKEQSHQLTSFFFFLFQIPYLQLCLGRSRPVLRNQKYLSISFPVPLALCAGLYNKQTKRPQFEGRVGTRSSVLMQPQTKPSSKVFRVWVGGTKCVFYSWWPAEESCVTCLVWQALWPFGRSFPQGQKGYRTLGVHVHAVRADRKNSFCCSGSQREPKHTQSLRGLEVPEAVWAQLPCFPGICDPSHLSTLQYSIFEFLGYFTNLSRAQSFGLLQRCEEWKTWYLIQAWLLK